VSKEFVSLSPGELNRFLSDEHGLGLYPLASILHHVILEPVSAGRPERPTDEGWDYPGWHPTEGRFLTDDEKSVYLACVQPVSPEEDAMNRAGLFGWENFSADRDVIRCLRKKIVNLKDKIEETVREIDELEYGNRAQGRDEELERLANWGAGEFLSTLQCEYARLGDLLAAIGRPPSARTEIACLWAQHLRRAGNRVPWTLLADLMDWFSEKFSPYDSYQGMLGGDELCDPENIRHKFFKHTDRWELIYSYRFRERPPLSDGQGPAERDACVLAFGRARRECGAILRVGDRELHPIKFPSEVIETARRILWSPFGSGNGAVFPDLSFFSEELPPKPC